MSAAEVQSIKLTTNRFVILDDPKSASGLGEGYSSPAYPWDWGDYWSGENTTIRAYALVLNEKGLAISGKSVTFSLKYPNGTVADTQIVTTDNTGIASYSHDLNNVNYYGNWTIEANCDGATASTIFIYNWWGCAICHGKSRNPSKEGTTTANSPYLHGWDPIVGVRKGGGGRYPHIDHSNYFTNNNTNQCIHCHQSYDGLPRGDKSAIYNNYPAGFHGDGTRYCNDSTCHGSYDQHKTDQLIGSCYASGCHPRTDISSKSTLDSGISIYSDVKPPNGTPLKYHDSDSKVPCIYVA